MVRTAICAPPMPAASVSSVPLSLEKMPNRSANSSEITIPGEPVSRAIGAVTRSLKVTEIMTRLADPSYG